MARFVLWLSLHCSATWGRTYTHDVLHVLTCEALSNGGGIFTPRPIWREKRGHLQSSCVFSSEGFRFGISIFKSPTNSLIFIPVMCELFKWFQNYTRKYDISQGIVSQHASLIAHQTQCRIKTVCVCVCEREREREREGITGVNQKGIPGCKERAVQGTSYIIYSPSYVPCCQNSLCLYTCVVCERLMYSPGRRGKSRQI